MNKFKFITGLLILAVVLSCSKISERVEKKVNEKIDKTIEENMNKIDSSLKNSNLDSLKKLIKQLDTTFDNENRSGAKKK